MGAARRLLCFSFASPRVLLFTFLDETESRPASRVLHQHPPRRKLERDVRDVGEIHARGEDASLPGQALRHRAAPEQPGLARAFGQNRVAGVPEMARPAQLLHFHYQWISLRKVSRHPRQGTGLCAGLDHPGAAGIHEIVDRFAGPTVTRRCGRQREHPALRIQAAGLHIRRVEAHP